MTDQNPADAVSEFDQAVADREAAQELLDRLTSAAAGAAFDQGADKEWLNPRLVALGAKPITATSTYRINVPMTGLLGMTVEATSRTEATAAFQRRVAALVGRGSKINDCHRYGDNVYRIVVDQDALAAPTFYSGPEDPDGEPVAPLSLIELKDGIRQFLRAAVVETSWGYYHANRTLAKMGLDALPKLVRKQVQVSVSGTVGVSVLVYEAAGLEEVQAATAAYMAKNKHVHVQPDEVGEAVLVKPEAEDDEDDEDSYDPF